MHGVAIGDRTLRRKGAPNQGFAGTVWRAGECSISVLQVPQPPNVKIPHPFDFAQGMLFR